MFWVALNAFNMSCLPQKESSRNIFPQYEEKAKQDEGENEYYKKNYI